MSRMGLLFKSDVKESWTKKVAVKSGKAGGLEEREFCPGDSDIFPSLLATHCSVPRPELLMVTSCSPPGFSASQWW